MTKHTSGDVLNAVVVHVAANGFVTDFGESLELTNVETGSVATIPRYGVWRRREPSDVVFVTDSLDAARARAEEER